MGIYKEIAAPLEFSGYIRKFWILDNYSSRLASAPVFALPNTCFTIVFVNGGGLIAQIGGELQQISHGIYICGQLSQRMQVTLAAGTRALMVQMEPWSAALFSGFDFSDITNQIVELEQLNRSMSEQLTKVDPDDETALINTFQSVFKQYMYPNTDSQLMRSVFGLLSAQGSHSRLMINDISAKTGYSKRAVEKKFNRYIGLSAKEIQTILRVRNVVDELKKPARLPLTETAYRHGFYDQSHFIKTYKKIMNTAPGDFEQSDYILPEK